MAAFRKSCHEPVRRRAVIALVMLVAGLAGCPGGKRDASKPTTGADHMKESVDAVFQGLEQGRVSPPGPAPVDGWQTQLPGGRVVARSMLQAEAQPLIALGADAVPALLPWVRHANAGVRYVAVFALGEITGEHPQIGHFDDDPAPREHAIEAWRRWYEQRTAAAPRP
jgi:hypothetical protein